MKQFSSRDFIKLLRTNGFQLFRTSGSHRIFKRGNQTIVVPLYLNVCIAQRLIKQNNLK